eukprot:2271558-Heterocapsa_arctica.AAC.1
MWPLDSDLRVATSPAQSIEHDAHVARADEVARYALQGRQRYVRGRLQLAAGHADLVLAVLPVLDVVEQRANAAAVHRDAVRWQWLALLHLGPMRRHSRRGSRIGLGEVERHQDVVVVLRVRRDVHAVAHPGAQALQ